MWEFLKKIFSENEGEVTVIVLDENEPDLTSTFKLKSFDVVKIIIGVTLISVLLTIAIFFITPLNSVYQQRLDDNFRDEVIAINERVLALQDSLIAREVQLNDLKNFVRTVPDTTFDVDSYAIPGRAFTERDNFFQPSVAFSYEMLTRNDIMNALQRERRADFPTSFPVPGALTQGFSEEIGHYGIDIAATSNSEFRSIADGAVINTNWTINYGYVIQVQHADGVMSVYKHASQLIKEKGDYVLRGDILGLVGDRGVMSTGSHLHVEIWKNGIPQNPMQFFN